MEGDLGVAYLDASSVFPDIRVAYVRRRGQELVAWSPLPSTSERGASHFCVLQLGILTAAVARSNDGGFDCPTPFAITICSVIKMRPGSAMHAIRPSQEIHGAYLCVRA